MAKLFAVRTHSTDITGLAILPFDSAVQCCTGTGCGHTTVVIRNHAQEDELAEHALWCRRFASVNATGLRKIAKKHDKYAHNDAGKQFVRVCIQHSVLHADVSVEVAMHTHPLCFTSTLHPSP